MVINRYFDHTLLSPDAGKLQIKKLCDQAKAYEFYAVCVNSSYVSLAAEALSGSDVKIAAVVGFPLGACSTEAKAFEAADACRKGAAEIDMVIQIGRLKDGDTDYVKDDIAAVVKAAADYKAAVKVILETCLLTEEEIVCGCRLAAEAGAAFVKTSTGFSNGGATREHVALMKRTVGDSLKVKASGGIRSLQDALAMIEAGADRIGASASVEIMKEFFAGTN